MARERAKELAREQKAARKAEKLRKKHSEDPSDWGTWRQLREVYKFTKEADPATPWKLLAAFVLPLIVFIVIGIFVKPIWLWVIFGISGGAAAASFMFTRLAKDSAYKRHRGQPGSAEVAFVDLPKKKWTITPTYTATKQGEVVHRLVGSPGIVLVGEGEKGRLKKLLDAETRRHEQVAYGVEVFVIQMGDKDGQVPLEKLAREIKRLPKKLDTVQIEETINRLKALDNLRGQLPIPKGPLPTHISRRALKGR